MQKSNFELKDNSYDSYESGDLLVKFIETKALVIVFLSLFLASTALSIVLLFNNFQIAKELEKEKEVLNRTTDSLIDVLQKSKQESIKILLNYCDSDFTIPRYRQVGTLLDVSFKDIVEKQHILETGNFTSSVFRNKNNLGGYMNNNGNYHSFYHWVDCMWFTKRFQMEKYDTTKYASYWEFLEKLPYATAPNYVPVVKTIELSNNNKSN